MASLNLWCIADLARFQRERETLVALASRENWLTLGPCRFDSDGCLVVDCDIDIGHRVYQAILRYPETFPHSPPAVRPRDGQARWTVHQFGDGGDLCLEYRPDNWSPDLMGWQMVESAYRLLQGENPGPDERARVATAHHATEGQRLRSAFGRLPLTRSIVERLAQLPGGVGARGSSVLYLTEANLVRMITRLDLPTGESWVDAEVPSILGSDTWESPVYVRRLAPGEAVPSVASYDDFVAGAEPLGWTAVDRLFLILDGNKVHAYNAFDNYVSTVSVIPPPIAAPRVSDDHRNLADRRVAILGCGSVGSKMATMLARAGVARFDLVDDDLLLADNVIRHELDWREVGQHKAVALAHRLRRVRPGIEVRTRCQQLAGQESATSAENILSRLAECDLIVDATANPAARNVLSGLSQATGIPLVWAEVFAGGVGGLIARHRPGIEPPVPLMHRAIENWFAESNASPPAPAANYERLDDGVPLIADDADVTTIAAHAARLAIDTLLRREPSYFPWSIYVIGMAPCDLFSEAFKTYPILLPEPPPEPPAVTITGDEAREQLAFLAGLITGPAALT